MLRKIINEEGKEIIIQTDVIAGKSTLVSIVSAGSATKFTVPDNIEVIEKHAFCHTQFLEITLPGSVKELKTNCFENSNVRKVVFNSHTPAIPVATFLNCKKLEEVVLPINLKVIRTSAFAGCENLKQIVLPESIESIERNVFNSCKSLTEITLPKNLKFINSSTFINCTKLRKVNFSKELNCIGVYAFKGCISLESVKLPDTLTLIDTGAFDECFSLNEVILSKNTEIIKDKAFNVACFNKIALPDTLKTLSDTALPINKETGLPRITVTCSHETLANFLFLKNGNYNLNIINPTLDDLLDANVFEKENSLKNVNDLMLKVQDR